jgi:hypothetical protein
MRCAIASASARRIRADEIDILVDLNGLTLGARLEALRWKPAPVQALPLLMPIMQQPGRRSARPQRC